MSIPLQDISVLSDDDDGHAICHPASESGRVAKRQPAKRKVEVTRTMVDLRPNVQALRKRVDGQCGCLCQCFKPFRESATFDELTKVRTQMGLLDKLDQDNFAFSLD